MTRAQLEVRVYQYLNKSLTPDSVTEARIRGFMADRLHAVLSLSGMERLRGDTITLASVADQDRYGLPLSVAKVERIVDRSNYLPLQERTIDWLRQAWPNPAQTTSTPVYYVLHGYQAVQLQPSNASEVFAKSTGADTTQTIRVEGFVTGGLPRLASVTLNGTTAVTLSSSITTWIAITKVYLSAVAVGTVSLHEDSGVGTTLAQIAIGDTSSQYQSLYLAPTPSSVRTYTLDYERTITDLAQNTDSPPIPVDFHPMLVDGTCADELAKLDDTRAQWFEARWQDKLGKLKAWINSDASTRIVPCETSGGYSDLGAYYPADRGGFGG